VSDTMNPIPREIGRANQHDVLIKWADGHESVYLARDLRLHCPCAGCVEEMTGRKMIDEMSVAADVHPLGIEIVGRYAIQIRWSDGHDTGIYRFELLRELCPCPKCKGSPAPSPETHASEALAAAISPRSAAPSAVAAASTSEIHGDTTMAEVLAAYPSAQRALFRRYHIGGCSSCGFEPSEKLGDVCARKGITDIDEVVAFILHSDAADKRLQISPADVQVRLAKGEPIKLIDVRQPYEWEAARIPGAVLISEELVNEMENWAKDTPIILYCHKGERSLDAAAYFAGHGFTSVKSMTGGIDAWSAAVDSSIPRYQSAPHGHGAHLKPV
jgi:rhodanese-related sulfurtransferase/DUF971 family protein